ncbi:alpha/beta fold hydrolase [Acinetobacter sp. WZC-1]|uniref:alpha/beta fold hydrolase n=1 Tax=Acinetobacter sp. WZC-1 TaxID=3459034 RepID=UPI00403D861D
MLTRQLSCLTLFMVLTSSVMATDTPAYGERLEGFNYSWPVKNFTLTSQNQSLEMAYLDVKPKLEKSNGRTVVLMHGKNFCAGTWDRTIRVLSDSGYRVIAPDQIGFCKSSKPEHYQYTFQQLANNTHALLNELGIDRVTIIGHSTGGMLATRYSLMWPQQVEKLVMVNPIGLEDWKALGVPHITVDQWYQRELKTNADKIRQYEKNTYYAGEWKPEYERWVTMLAGLNNGQGKKHVAWNSALIYDMIYTQPVIYEFSDLKMPVLLIIGTKDNTAIGKDLAPPEIRKQLGNYAVLGKETSRRIPRATLVEFNDMGHAPQMQNPEQFHETLLKELKVH